MASIHQQKVTEYHASISQEENHDGNIHSYHNMYLFHRDWHNNNPSPTNPRPYRPRRNWGVDKDFGTKFLQMHHEMLRAKDNEPKYHMKHDSIVSWYQKQGYGLPNEWNPMDAIPEELGYKPDLSVFPQEIQNFVSKWALNSNQTPKEYLTRKTNSPQFTLPKYFTRKGISDGEKPEPITGARKLADFINTNQLGCCLVYPHDKWHVHKIGGAMALFETSIADPIFYFGVHWQIDLIYEEYRSMLPITDDDKSKDIKLPKEFTPEQIQMLEEAIKIDQQLRGIFNNY